MSSVIVAVGALILAWRADRRSQEQFTANLKLQQKIADANLQPQLTVHVEKPEDKRAIILMNEGLGPAKGVKVTYAKGDRQSMTNIADVMGMPSFPFRYHVDAVLHIVDAQGIPIGSGNHRDIFAVTRAHLLEQMLNEDQIHQLFDEIDSRLRGITIRITHSDGFGKEQPEFSINLDEVILNGSSLTH